MAYLAPDFWLESMDSLSFSCDESLLWLLCIISFLESSDAAVLSASMIALEADLGLSMIGLGFLYASGGLATSMFGVVWGILADRTSRKGLLALSCIGWGLFSLLGALAQSVPVLFMFRFGQQAMLSSLGPITQSVVADAYEPQYRGTMFGRIGMGAALGDLLIKPLTLAIAEEALLFGVRGWRAMLAFIGLLGLLAALLITHLMKEPERERGSQEHACDADDLPSRQHACSVEFARFLRLLCIPSFAVLFGQGIFGCMAMFASTSFSLVFLRHCGYSGDDIAVINIFTGVASFIASPLNGAIPDRFARWSSAHGRPFAAQVSVTLGALVFASWVLVAPKVSIPTLTLLMCLEILVGRWVTPGVKLPILSEIVPSDERATTMAWLCSLEGSLGSLLGPPFVGLLAEKMFNYRPPREGEPQEQNGHALGSAMLWCTLVPWMLQVAVFFSMLHVTYGRDAEKVQAHRSDSLPRTLE